MLAKLTAALWGLAAVGVCWKFYQLAGPGGIGPLTACIAVAVLAAESVNHILERVRQR